MTRPLRVVHVISSLEGRFGGPTAALVGLASAQAELGMDVSVITCSYAASPAGGVYELCRSGVRVTVAGRAFGPTGWVPGLRTIVEAAIANAQIVHIHGLWEDLLHHAAVAARRTGAAVVVTPCGMLDPWSLSRHPLRKRLYLALRVRQDLERADLLHFASLPERDQAERLSLRPRGVVVPNAVDPSQMAALKPGALRARSDLAGRPIVLFLGRLHEVKGIDLLLKAVNRLDPRPALVIAGPGHTSYRRRLERMIERLGLLQDVTLLGPVYGRGKWEAMAEADLFVLPSRQESFGLAVVEAMAVGTPVIVSDQVKLSPIIRNADAGGVVPLDEIALAAEIQTWLSDAPRRAEAGRKGRALVLQEFTWKKQAEQWRALYQELSTRP